MRILITGISGLLGNALSQILSKNYQVFGTYYKDKNLIVENRAVKVFECDISDKTALFKKFGQLNSKPEVIVRTAGLTNIEFCELNQENCWRVNTIGTKNICEVAKKYGARLIYISTVSVFSGRKGGYKENDIPYPQNFYSLTKLLGEKITLSYEKGVVLRINMIGLHPKRKKPANFLEWLVEKIRANEDIALFEDVRINPLSPFTIAEIINKILIKETKEKILHLGSKNILSKADIGKIIIKKFSNYKGKVKISSVDKSNLLAKCSKEMWLCPKFIEKKLGIKMPYLREEIEKILEQDKRQIQEEEYEKQIYSLRTSMDR